MGSRVRELRRAVTGASLARKATALGVVVLLIAAAVAGVVLTRTPPARADDYMIPVLDGPDRDQQVFIDSTVYVPHGVDAGHKAPAVLLAHGFGGTKDDLVGDAQHLADQGYVVLAYTARGFGKSTGQVAMDSPDYEVADASGLLDWLADRSYVQLDAPGDPRVGVYGGSYGGALALLLAGYDDRVDAIAPAITWNDLGRSFFPNGVAGSPTDTGVYKRLWAGLLFGAGAGLPTSSGTTGGAPAAPTTPDAQLAAGLCGRFDPAICQAYGETAATGKPTRQLLDLLDRSSPKTVLSRIKAPTLLMQGETDSLFPLSEGKANADGIAATGTPVKVVWFAGGHDGSGELAEVDRLHDVVDAWFGHWLKDGPDPGTEFEYTRISPPRASDTSAPRTRTVVAPAFPATPAQQKIPLEGPEQPALNPPGANPAALSSLPGLGDLGAGLAATGLGGELPGQFAAYQSQPLTDALEIVGAPTATISVTSTGTEAVLFGKVYDVDAAGKSELPQRLVAPIRVTGLTPGTPRTVTIALPAIVHRFDAGHRLRLVIATTDQAYGLPTGAAAYKIRLAGELAAPVVPGTPKQTGASPVYWLAGGLVVVALAALVGWRVTRRLRARGVVLDDPELAEVPLVVDGLRKRYKDGLLAVDGVSFRVEQGQVCGLLGPNGAGKTTALRTLMGLVLPTEGTIRVFGRAITPGAPVLARVGAFVEGPGFLPHLSGIDNLTLYWRATGRPLDEARLDEVLEVAGLGDAVRRKVRGYSQGMRQRLAIAQAMLGLPDLLVLDEPTNGLDPPQIRAMRDVLRDYAAGGKTVVVSSHLLAEIEQTCTHVVVMNHGRLIAAGPVGELAGAGRLEDAFLDLLERETV